nr:MAG TPA: hypothetical protein [Caudoviricetes sp.]
MVKIPLKYMHSKQNKNSPLMILFGESKNSVQAIYYSLN